MPNRYFSNWGQVVQVCCVLICTPIAIWNAFPDLKKNDLFTAGAFVAYFLVVIFIGTAIHLGKVLLRSGDTTARPAHPSEQNELQALRKKYDEAIRASSAWETRCDATQKQLEELRGEKRGKAAETPQVLVAYRKTKTEWERLAFRNEWSKSIVNLSVGPLVREWTTKNAGRRSTHRITMTPSAIPSISPDSTEEARIIADREPHHGTTLRELICQGPKDSIDTLFMQFEDLENNRFEQVLTLLAQTDGGIRFDYGPVKRRPAASAAESVTIS